MFEVFKGDEPGFHQQFKAIQDIVRHECKIELIGPQNSEHYIYWQDALNLAQGCAVIKFDSDKNVYTLNCIAFYVEDSLIEILQDNHNMYDQLIRQFYHDIYPEFCKLLKDHDSLMVNLPSDPIEDSLMLGHWPYKELSTDPHALFHSGQLDITAAGNKMYRDSHYYQFDEIMIH